MTPVSAGLPRILTIEDDLVLGAYVHEHLGRCGFQVTWCQNGREGLEMARAQAFDVVLMDILLPGMDGLAVLTDLRASDSTPVVLMSALGAEADRISGFRLGGGLTALVLALLFRLGYSNGLALFHQLTFHLGHGCNDRQSHSANGCAGIQLQVENFQPSTNRL